MTTVDKHDAAHCHAEAILTGACRVLESSSADSVAALISLLPLDQSDGALTDWQRDAARLAEAHHLDVQFSASETHLRLRFSRRVGV